MEQDMRGACLLDDALLADNLRSAIEETVEALATELTPERIERYVVLKSLGRGGMGVVYLAEQDNPRREVAVKVIAPGAASTSLLRRFQHEASILGQLSHPGIARIYEAGVADVRLRGGMRAKWPFLAMEYVRGDALHTYVAKDCRSTRRRLELLAAICDAVQHAHQKGVVHRDLKPANILVDGEGQAKILDFGVARLTNADVQTVSMQTASGCVVGTLPYMSPEQVSGVPHEIDTRSDVYALGMIGYEMLTGGLPYDVPEHSIPEAARIIQETPPARLSRVDARYRGDLDTIVCKALEKDKRRRYQSASELAADLRNYLAGQPITARPPTTLYQLRMFARRNKALVGGVLATFLTLWIGLVGIGWQAARATRERDHAQSAERLADERRTLAERRAYAATIAAAQAALTANDVATSRQRLGSAPAYLRNWEWRYLAAQLDASLMTLEGHKDIVWTVVYDPNGEWLASSSTDGTVQIWDLREGRVVRSLDPGRGTIRGLDVAPDGERIVTATYGGETVVWEVATGELVLSLAGHRHGVLDAAFSPDGALVASGGIDHVACIWDAHSGELLATFPHPGWVFDVCFAPDSQYLATTCRDNAVRLWDLRSGELALTIDVLPASSEWDYPHCWEVAFSPDAHVLAVGAHDGVIRLYDPVDGRLLKLLVGHSARVRSLVFSADGARLVSGSDDGTVRLWDPIAGLALATLLGHEDAVFGVSYAPDGAHVASASADHTVRIWDARSQRAATRITAHDNRGIKAVDVFADSRRIVSGGYDGSIAVWDSRTGENLLTLRGHTGGVRTIALSPDGTRVVSGSEDHTVRVWNLQTGDEVIRLNAHTNTVEAVAFLPGGGSVASAALDGTIRATTVPEGNEILCLSVPEAEFTALGVSPDGRQLVSGTIDGRVAFWDISGERRFDAASSHGDRIWQASYRPDGEEVVTASDDGTLKLWSPHDGRLIATLEGHRDRVRAAAFSPDGSRLASISHDRTLRLWDSAMHETVLSFRAHQDWPMAVRFSPDGSWLVSSGKSIRFWRTGGATASTPP